MRGRWYLISQKAACCFHIMTLHAMPQSARTTEAFTSASMHYRQGKILKCQLEDHHAFHAFAALGRSLILVTFSPYIARLISMFLMIWCCDEPALHFEAPAFNAAQPEYIIWYMRNALKRWSTSIPRVVFRDLESCAYSFPDFLHFTWGAIFPTLFIGWRDTGSLLSASLGACWAVVMLIRLRILRGFRITPSSHAARAGDAEMTISSRTFLIYRVTSRCHEKRFGSARASGVAVACAWRLVLFWAGVDNDTMEHDQSRQ